MWAGRWAALAGDMLRTRGLPLLRAALGPARGPGLRAASSGRGLGWRRPAGCDTGVRVHNSLTGRKDPLVVARADAVSWCVAGLGARVRRGRPRPGLTCPVPFVPRYSCGPTVYDHAHLGHAW